MRGFFVGFMSLKPDLIWIALKRDAVWGDLPTKYIMNDEDWHWKLLGENTDSRGWNRN